MYTYGTIQVILFSYPKNGSNLYIRIYKEQGSHSQLAAILYSHISKEAGVDDQARLGSHFVLMVNACVFK